MTSPWRIAVGRRIGKRGLHYDRYRIVRNLLDTVSTVQVKVLDVMVDASTTLEQLEEVCGSMAVVQAVVTEPPLMGMIERFIDAIWTANEEALARAQLALVPHDETEVVRRVVQPCLEFLYYEDL